MSNQVHYHQQGRDPIVLEIVKKHNNGTVDLAREKGGEAIIVGVSIEKEPVFGSATLLKVEKTVSPLRELRAKAKKLTADAEKARLAAEGAKGTPEEEALTKAAVEALEAAEAATKELEAAEAGTE